MHVNPHTQPLKSLYVIACLVASLTLGASRQERGGDNATGSGKDSSESGHAWGAGKKAEDGRSR